MVLGLRLCRHGRVRSGYSGRIEVTEPLSLHLARKPLFKYECKYLGILWSISVPHFVYPSPKTQAPIFTLDPFFGVFINFVVEKVIVAQEG